MKYVKEHDNYIDTFRALGPAVHNADARCRYLQNFPAAYPVPETW
jgi:hypothetical protein